MNTNQKLALIFVIIGILLGVLLKCTLPVNAQDLTTPEAPTWQHPAYPYVWGWYIPNPGQFPGWAEQALTLEISDSFHISLGIRVPPNGLYFSLGLFGAYGSAGAPEIFGVKLGWTNY